MLTHHKALWRLAWPFVRGRKLASISVNLSKVGMIEDRTGDLLRPLNEERPTGSARAYRSAQPLAPPAAPGSPPDAAGRGAGCCDRQDEPRPRRTPPAGPAQVQARPLCEPAPPRPEPPQRQKAAQTSDQPRDRPKHNATGTGWGRSSAIRNPRAKMKAQAIDNPVAQGSNAVDRSAPRTSDLKGLHRCVLSVRATFGQAPMRSIA